MEAVMKIGIMQPYFLPYIGYWQLINSVDRFVIYDNIEYEKNGWLRRNRVLVNGEDKLFTIPIKKESDFLNVNQKHLIENYKVENKKIWKRICTYYQNAPYFKNVAELLESCFLYENDNLFEFILHSILMIKEYLQIKSAITISSEINMDHSLKNRDRVIEICKMLKGSQYFNPIGGLNLYNKKDFKENGIDLFFLKSVLKPYKQWNCEFVPGLSIIDILMFNTFEQVQQMLMEYQLI